MATSMWDPNKKQIRWNKVIENLVAYVLLIIFMVALLFPYYWMIITAFRPEGELIRLEDSLLWTKHPTTENFTELFNETPFKNWMKNSLVVAVSTTTFSLIVGTLAAYSLVRFRFPGARLLGLSMFITYLVPPILLFLPMLTIMRELELYNSRTALIVVYPTFLVPFSTWFLMGFFRSIPRDMEECARVDGATYWQAFYKVTLPLARPGLISAGIFSFTLAWGEYLYARGLILSRNYWTLAVGVPSELTRTDVFFWGMIMAAALLGSLPITIVYSFFMKAFVSGMTSGAVKG